MAKVRTRKRGKTYSYVFEAGQVNGKRKVIEKGGYPSADAAYTAGVEAFTNWKHGNIGITSERMNLSDFMSLWLKRVEKDIRITTYENYQSIINTRITPVLGALLIQDLRPAVIDSWLQDLYSEGYTKGYINQCRMILHEALNYAVYPCELIMVNPCAYVKVPKNAVKSAVKRHIIDSERFHELIHIFPLGDTLHVPIALMWHTGMRIGETLGLAWNDIDFEEKSITIRHQRIYCKGTPTRTRLTTTKTEQSKRKIYITDELVNILRQEQERQKHLRIINVMDKDKYCYSHSAGLALCEGLTPIGLVCVNKFGKMASRNSICGSLRLQGLNSHSFRHTQATRLAAAGVPPVTAARRLGHAKPDMTLNVYTHDTVKQQKAVVSALELEQWDKFFSS